MFPRPGVQKDYPGVLPIVFHRICFLNPSMLEIPFSIAICSDKMQFAQCNAQKTSRWKLVFIGGHLNSFHRTIEVRFSATYNRVFQYWQWGQVELIL